MELLARRRVVSEWWLMNMIRGNFASHENSEKGGERKEN